MRVMLISRGDVFPPIHGAASRIVNTARYLSRLDCEVIFLPLHSDRYYIFENGGLRDVEFSLFLKNIRSRVDKIDSILMKMDIPPEDHILYRPLFSRELIFRSAVLAFNNDIDIIQAEFPAFALPAWFARKLSFKSRIRQVLVEHNIEFERIGVSSPSISKRGIKNLKRIERFACHISDMIVAVSEGDRERLSQLKVKNNKITVIPHGVDLENYIDVDINGKRIRERLGIPNDHIVLFYHGVYTYRPNREALVRIVNNILPALQRKNIKAVLIAAGQDPPDEVKREGVYLVGPVEDLPSFIGAADICLVPLTGGGGTRLKVLEYFAANRPVISTHKGIEGISVRDGEEYLRAELDEDFVRYIAEFSTLKERFYKIAENGNRFVQQYDWSNIARRYIALYESLLSR